MSEHNKGCPYFYLPKGYVPDCPKCHPKQEKQDWEARLSPNEWLREIKDTSNISVGFLEEYWKTVVPYIRIEIAKAREEGRAEVLQKIEEWAETYMDETTRIYGTDKHGIDCGDLLNFINSLKHEHQNI